MPVFRSPNVCNGIPNFEIVERTVNWKVVLVCLLMYLVKKQSTQLVPWSQLIHTLAPVGTLDLMAEQKQRSVEVCKYWSECIHIEGK